MPKIIDKVLAKKALLNTPGPTGTAAAADNTRRAIAAVTGGIKSTAWETYMQQFADNQDQLDRLMAVDGTEDDQALIDNRAYLVSNGVCGEGTRTRFDENVMTIDRDLEEDCNPTP